MDKKRDILEIGDLFAFYESEPEIYEILSQSEDTDNRILKTILSDISFKNKIVLDLGAGTGRFSITISSKAELVFSLDISGKALEILKRKAKGKRVEILKGVFGNIPLSDESVDMVLSAWAFPASSPNAESDFKDILRVIKKGGKIIVVENYPGGEYLLVQKHQFSTVKKAKHFRVCICTCFAPLHDSSTSSKYSLLKKAPWFFCRMEKIGSCGRDLHLVGGSNSLGALSAIARVLNP